MKPRTLPDRFAAGPGTACLVGSATDRRQRSRVPLGDAMNVLVICTANICRSPMAAELLRFAADRRGATVHVDSAGLLPGGRPVSPGSVRALAALGLSIEGHVSRRLERHMVSNADLVLTMEARHISEAAVLAPQRFGRIFTLREIVNRLPRAGPLRERPLDEWLEELGEGRSARELLTATGLDIDDPYGGSDEDYTRACTEIARLTSILAEALWGPAR